MRKRFRVLLLAAIVVAAVVPFGFALSVQSTSEAGRASHILMSAAASDNNTSGALVRPGNNSLSESLLFTMPDSAALFFVGALLFGVAAAVRKANLS